MDPIGPSVFDLSPSEKLQLVKICGMILRARRRPSQSKTGKRTSWLAERRIF
jgi:hypothetical protein